MFVRDLAAAGQRLEDLTSTVDPNAVTPAEAATLFDELAHLERVVAGTRLRLAARAAQADAWRDAHERTPAHWIARRCGISVHASDTMITTSRKLTELPKTDAAVANAQLSPGQAAIIADAAADGPIAERPLIDTARREGWAALRHQARQAKAAACPDPEERRRKAHARRAFTSSTHDQTWTARITTSVDQGARIEAWLKPFVERVFDDARREGRREPLAALRVDALEHLGAYANRTANPTNAGADHDDESAGPKGPQAQLVLLASLPALRRGHLRADEICEIDGVGPVSLDVAREVLGDAALSIVITDGVDVRNVTRHSRKWSPEQRTALLVRDRTCVVEGCTNRAYLEIHHTPPFEQTHHSRIDEAARVCKPDHRRITHDGYEVERRANGRWHLHPPPGAGPPRDDVSDQPDDIDLVA